MKHLALVLLVLSALGVSTSAALVDIRLGILVASVIVGLVGLLFVDFK